MADLQKLVEELSALTIMEAAEEIMGADPSDSDAYTATTQDAVMRIFEACSFQDITGQRISKVVETLSHIEKRVMELRNLLGVTEEDIEEAKERWMLSDEELEEWQNAVRNHGERALKVTHVQQYRQP